MHLGPPADIKKPGCFGLFCGEIASFCLASGTAPYNHWGIVLVLIGRNNALGRRQQTALFQQVLRGC